MSREQLVSIARRGLAHRAAGTQDQADGVFEVAAADYVDPAHWQLEIDRVFRRVPLVVAASCELREPSAYIAGEIAGIPYLVSRGDDGELRAFYNVCSHRGAIVTSEGTGVARRHTCRYHAWSYDSSGRLVGVLDADDFGDIDRSCLGLTPLPCVERAGLVWISPSAEPAIDIDTFLAGYGEMLDHLGLAECHAVGRQTLTGPNWKLAFDGYLDLYHLPILHRDTFGPNMPTTAMYDAWGPHQRVTSPTGYDQLVDVREEEWTIRQLNGGVWTIFPHVSIAGFDAGGRAYMVSLLSPGDEPGTSTTVQLFLHTRPPDDAQPDAVRRLMEFNHDVVQNEDYWMGGHVQRALRSGAKSVCLFGRNESGGQHFHRFLADLLATDDHDLPDLFARTGPAGPTT